MMITLSDEAYDAYQRMCRRLEEWREQHGCVYCHKREPCDCSEQVEAQIAAAELDDNDYPG